MGLILGEKKLLDFLRNHKFVYDDNDVIGALGAPCWERCISLNSSYDMWVSVSADGKKVLYYVEYECGGEVGRGSDIVPNDIDVSNEEEFVTWLDKVVTEFGERYR